MFTQKQQQQLIDRYGFSNAQVTRLLHGEDGGKNVNAVIMHAKALLDLPLDQEAITVLAARSGGHNRIDALIEHRDVALNFGLGETYKLLCKRNGCTEFIEDYVEPMRRDQKEFGYVLEPYESPKPSVLPAEITSHSYQHSSEWKLFEFDPEADDYLHSPMEIEESLLVLGLGDSQRPPVGNGSVVNSFSGGNKEYDPCVQPQLKMDYVA